MFANTFHCCTMIRSDRFISLEDVDRKNLPLLEDMLIKITVNKVSWLNILAAVEEQLVINHPRGPVTKWQIRSQVSISRTRLFTSHCLVNHQHSIAKYKWQFNLELAPLWYERKTMTFNNCSNKYLVLSKQPRQEICRLQKLEKLGNTEEKGAKRYAHKWRTFFLLLSVYLKW